MLYCLTPLILTYNEEANIGRAIASLKWARQIVVIDSGSTDGTLDILRNHPQIRVIHRRFDDFASQLNFGLQQITTPWVLSLDADYVVSPSLVEEILSIDPDGLAVAYRAEFRYVIQGRPLYGTLYPSRIVLLRRDVCRYIPDGHAQIVETVGSVGRLSARIDHDDRKSLSRWLDSQRSYARLEAEHLLTLNAQPGSWPDRLRLWIWPAAPAAFLYTLLVKWCLFDGWRGWYYVLQRTYAEILLSLELLDRQLGGTRESTPVPPRASNEVQSSTGQLGA